MKHKIKYKERKYTWDDEKPIDISIPIINNANFQPNCFHAPPFEAQPVRSGDFVGSTKLGGAVNFFDYKINPHGNGTHTECVGHISQNGETINQTLRSFHTICRLISVEPETADNGDKCITKDNLVQKLEGDQPLALVIRSLPNSRDKMHRNYSGTNPAYLTKEAIEFIVSKKVQHLLIDLPSVDREEDGGALFAHKAFWQFPDNIRSKATISELIFVDNMVKDDVYLLNIQIASFELDASPSKPVFYKLVKRK